MLKSLSDTSTFKYSEAMGSHKITNIIQNIASDKHGTVFVKEEQLEDVLYKIRHKSFNFSAKFAILTLFKRNVIKLIYSDRIKLTTAIPFFKYKMPDGKMGVIVNISNYAKMKSDGSIYIDPIVLYTLMLSAAFSINIDKYSGILINSGISDLYSSLFVNTISKIVNIDQIKRDKLKFLSAKFMYIQCGVNELSASNASAKHTKVLTSAEIDKLDMEFPNTAYNSLESLIDSINNVFTEFNGLSLASFFDKWMRSYGEMSAFSCEFVPMFITVFIALITNCNSLINVKAIEKEASRNNSKHVMLFNRIESILLDMAR